MKIECPLCHQIVHATGQKKMVPDDVACWIDKHYIDVSCWTNSSLGPVPHAPMKMTCPASHSGLKL